MDASSESKKKQVIDYFSDVSLPDYGVDSRFFSTMGKKLVVSSEVSRGAKVLDVAAGRGASLFPAAELAGETGEVIGIDLAEGMIQVTGMEIDRRQIRNASIRHMDAEELEFDAEYFHHILCGFALFFMPNLDKVLSEFYRVLKPGGSVAASTFGKSDGSFSWYDELLRKYGIRRDIPVIHSLEDPGRLEQIFSNAGFINIRVLEELYDSEYADEQDWWSHLWSTADRKALEGMSKRDRLDLRKEAFSKIRDFERNGKIHVPYRVLFTLAAKIEGE